MTSASTTGAATAATAATDSAGACRARQPRPRGPRVALRPGVRVVRRDSAHLQVGLDALQVVVPDTPATASILAELGSGQTVEPSRIDPLLRDRLDARGLLVDPAVMTALSPSGDRARASVTAAFAAHGPGAADHLAARRALGVEVAGGPDWSAQARELLVVSGLTVRTPDRRRRHDHAVLLLLGTGEPERSRLDAAVRAGRPHLVVAAVQGRVRIGPFVVPGVTACLRCLDAHLTEADPRRALVVEQQGEGPEPVDPVLATLAVACAVRELVTWAEGGRPSTWSATRLAGAGAGEPLLGDVERWAPHPHCGCSWGNRLPT
ncbi:TOMM precursor leader peptide-binding protein [Nocardioides sp. CFH 31398]|uniref:TOMM precursor leader peptide-binding protein n=1 Tax=Nocardioides sp. CFH 31398 TaxID=2919579 RepID=UPI001F05E822|nr:TOMM precursor leader peptide-binding protein [Nocardioides sp. CFH 31398]MCH1866510.1 TOMM precursor leader peptide-binding protein [Nocardioides sp. CFH 31398]